MRGITMFGSNGFPVCLVALALTGCTSAPSPLGTLPGSSSEAAGAAGAPPMAATPSAGMAGSLSTGTAGRTSTSVVPDGTANTAGKPAPSSAGTGAGSSAAGASGSGTAGSGAAGSGGAAGAAGGSGAAGAAAPHEDRGKGDGSDVVILGDSYMDNSLAFQGTGGGIVPSLQRASGQRYRNYAVQGTMLLMDDAFGPAIPTQWDGAKRANPKIKTVIMTGGGNDIIQSDPLTASCKSGGDECKQLLMNEAKAFDQLWSKMAEAGVEDIIRVGYAEDTGTVAPSLLALDLTPPICLTGRVRCHDLDTTALIMKQLAGDGIHPLQAANDRVAKAIVDLMTKEGIRR